MDNSRRQFLKFAGGALVAATGAATAGKALAEGEKPVETLAKKVVAKSNKLEKPPTGKEKWAMVIDLNKIKDGTVQCQKACHSIHNVPDFQGEDKRHEVKWIWQVDFENAFPEQNHAYLEKYSHNKPVMILCNHCENPPCVRACPTEATFQTKDGIVAMDYHRCIGCRFCISACPYGARSLNFRDPRTAIKKLDKSFPTRTKGVVEKCNFCVERLAQGLIPACVEAAKDDALVFGDLNDPESEVSKIVHNKFTIVRKPGLGTKPKVFYTL